MKNSWFIKNIEVYDGNYSSHYICKFGCVMMSIALLQFFITLPIYIYIDNAENALISAVSTLIIFIIGSCIGKEIKHNDK